MNLSPDSYPDSGPGKVKLSPGGDITGNVLDFEICRGPRVSVIKLLFLRY